MCQALWRGGPTPGTDPEVAAAVERVWCEPKPLQAGGVPLWISGRIHERTLRRIVRYGDGWIPWGEYRRDVVPGIRQVHDALDAAGRDPTRFQVRGTLPVAFHRSGAVDAERTMEGVPALVEAGVTDFGLAAALPRARAELVDLLVPLVDELARVSGRPPTDPMPAANPVGRIL